ncbi:MAG: ATP-binding protein [Candidatus Omnitrophota bacterium]
MKRSQQNQKTRNKIKRIISFNLPALAEWLKVPRIVTSVITDRMAFNKNDAEDIGFAIGEACANVVQHAYSKGKEGKIGIKFFIYSNKLAIFVRDKGKGFIFGAEDSLLLDKESQPGESIRGIPLIKKTMDKCEFKSILNEGTALKMVKYKKYRS